MQIKKMPTTRGSMAGALTKHLDRHFTTNQLKSAQIRHKHGSIIAPGSNHAKDVAAATLAEKRVFSRPEFMSLGLGVSIPQGRQHGDIHVITPSPIRLSNQQVSGCQSHVGANQMATSQSTPTPSMQGNTTHDQNQTDLFFQASNHLSQALYQLRNATGDQGIKTAAGRANAAARALNRLATAVSTKRKQVELVPVTDPRLAQHYPETSGGLSAEPDGPWLLAIGRKCTDQQLERFAQREGFSVAELVAFRDGLSESGVKA